MAYDKQARQKSGAAGGNRTKALYGMDFYSKISSRGKITLNEDWERLRRYDKFFQRHQDLKAMCEREEGA